MRLRISRMQTPRIQITGEGIGWAAFWFAPAALALRWIAGNEGVPLTIWWVTLAIAGCGVVVSLLGFGRIYVLLCVILFCAALLTMRFWIGMLVAGS